MKSYFNLKLRTAVITTVQSNKMLILKYTIQIVHLYMYATTLLNQYTSYVLKNALCSIPHKNKRLSPCFNIAFCFIHTSVAMAPEMYSTTQKKTVYQ